MFQVQDLKYATLATVSRCGMVWFSEDVLSTEMIFENYMSCLRNIPLEEADEDSGFGKKSENKEDVLSPALQVLDMSTLHTLVYWVQQLIWMYF